MSLASLNLALFMKQMIFTHRGCSLFPIYTLLVQVFQAVSLNPLRLINSVWFYLVFFNSSYSAKTTSSRKNMKVWKGTIDWFIIVVEKLHVLVHTLYSVIVLCYKNMSIAKHLKLVWIWQHFLRNRSCFSSIWLQAKNTYAYMTIIYVV